jgi:hypothetical protein
MFRPLSFTESPRFYAHTAIQCILIYTNECVASVFSANHAGYSEIQEARHVVRCGLNRSRGRLSVWALHTVCQHTHCNGRQTTIEKPPILIRSQRALPAANPPRIPPQPLPPEAPPPRAFPSHLPTYLHKAVLRSINPLQVGPSLQHSTDRYPLLPLCVFSTRPTNRRRAL